MRQSPPSCVWEQGGKKERTKPEPQSAGKVTVETFALIQVISDFPKPHSSKAPCSLTNDLPSPRTVDSHRYLSARESCGQKQIKTQLWRTFRSSYSYQVPFCTAVRRTQAKAELLQRLFGMTALPNGMWRITGPCLGKQPRREAMQFHGDKSGPDVTGDYGLNVRSLLCNPGEKAEQR